MTEAPRQIAVVTAITGYDGLNGAFRARAEELNITRDDVDVLGGLTRGHGSKILAAYPQKAIGRTTLGPILHALKLKLIVVPDDDVIWKDEPRGRRINRPVMLANGTHGIANMQESRALHGTSHHKATPQARAAKQPRSEARRARLGSPRSSGAESRNTLQMHAGTSLSSSRSQASKRSNCANNSKHNPRNPRQMATSQPVS
jgi:hypothetical protein